MQVCRPQRAFTLIEMVVTVSVLAILAAIAVPSFLNTLEKRRVVGAAEQLYADLQYARTEAIKGNRSVGINFTTSGTDTWCYGMDDTPTDATVCNCTSGVGCTVDTVTKVFRSDGYRGVRMPTPAFGRERNTGFEPRRGFPTGTQGTVQFISASGQINVVLSTQGRVRLCSPDSPSLPHLSGYPEC